MKLFSFVKELVWFILFPLLAFFSAKRFRGDPGARAALLVTGACGLMGAILLGFTIHELSNTEYPEVVAVGLLIGSSLYYIGWVGWRCLDKELSLNQPSE